MNKMELAHDLNSDVWRSEDISVDTYYSKAGQIEIILPNQNGQYSTITDVGVHKSNSSNSSNHQVTQQAIDCTFSSIKVSPTIVANLTRCGFVQPSPIQVSAIPLGRIGIDLIAQSKSGTGKTIVFVVCALELVLANQHQPPCPRVLIVTPTREIAVQISEIVTLLTNSWSNFNCYKAIGGTKVSENLEQLATSQVVVGTPGRLCCLLEMDLLNANSIRLLVLDECDKLMDDNFKQQINKLYSYLPANKQMIVTSATMSDEMTLFLANYMRTPALVRLNATNPALVGVLQLYHLTKGHSLEYLNFESKLAPLLSILSEISFLQCVIFCNYQTRAKYLYDWLVSAKWTAVYISGDMVQKERLEAINSFRRHKYRILVSTDLTSRGIDIDTINLIINVDVPLDSETYLHRIGRAGRFGSAGIAITLVGQGDDLHQFNSLINEYKLDVQELTLPIKVNPWSVFYQEQLDRNKTLLFKCFNDGFEMEPDCQQITARFLESTPSVDDLADSNGFDFVTHNSTESSVNLFTQEHDNLHYERKFLSTLLSFDVDEDNVDVNETESSLPQLISPSQCNFPMDVIEDQSKPNFHSELTTQSNRPSKLICDERLNTSTSDLINEKQQFIHNTEADHHYHHHQSKLAHISIPPPSPPPPTSITHEKNETLTCSVSNPINTLFKKTFLVPSIRNWRRVTKTDRSNLNLCKYLLKGGSNNSSQRCEANIGGGGGLIR